MTLGFVQAVLLDLDGTLVDRDAALRAWLRRRAGLAREIDDLLEIDRADASSLAGLSVELLRLRPGLGRDALALATTIRAELPRFIGPDPRVLAGLDRLARAGLGLALVSNGSGPTQRAKLAAARIDLRRFASVRISGELGRAKPDAAPFEAALADLGVPLGAALMIGDGPHTDIAGAAALGVRSWWLARGRDYPDDCPRPDHVYMDFPAAVAALLDSGKVEVEGLGVADQ